MARIFGIDLGTTNSLIAVMEGERPHVIADRRDRQSRCCRRWSRSRPTARSSSASSAIEMEPHLTVERDGRVSAIGFAGGEYGRRDSFGQALHGPWRRRDRRRRSRALHASPISAGRWCASRSASAPSRRRKFRPRFCARSRTRAEAALAGEKVERVVITVPGLLQRRPAPGHQGRRAASPASKSCAWSTSRPPRRSPTG